MAQEIGEIWTAETLLQPILPKSDRLLDEKDYRRLVLEAPGKDVSGGRTYDWVIALCAQKAKGLALLTFNLKIPR